MEHRSRRGFAAIPVGAAESEAPLTDLTWNFGCWIGKALAEPDLATGLNLLRHELQQAILHGRMSLPERFRVVQPDHYARRLLYYDPSARVSVLAMVWAPGQGTPLHDHSGLWVLEAVVAGEMESVRVDLTGEQNGQYYFQPRPAVREQKGATSFLIPPFEHHIMRNASQQVAVTLNVYGGELSACNVFVPTESGSYVRQRRALSYSD
jgi:predicted metal-dependent enzyme (double-stranded beta helix superfamily)